MKYDAVVIGAGISGLACAKNLIEQGLKVALLEAKSRIGGRILTQHEPNLEVPIELGAEFIHGTPKVLLHELEAHQIAFHDAGNDHLYLSGTHEDSIKFWKRV